jgi:putative methyltransferase (TIGR04325 family)
MAAKPESNLLYVVASRFHEPTRIVDFGGSTGELGESICNVLPDTQYTVVEHPVLVDRAHRLQPTPVSFMNAIPERCDIFFTGGTLQVIDDPYDLIETAFRTASKAVIFVRNCFSDREIVRVLHGRLFDNGSGPIPSGFANKRIRYAHRTIDERRLFQAAERHGFACIAQITENDGVLPYWDVVYGRQLAFVRGSALAPAEGRLPR